MSQFLFDATNVPVQQEITILPSGDYLARIDSFDVEPTSAGDGTKVKVVGVIDAPAEFRGRKFFDNINIQNKNPQAEKIGQEALSSICHSIGILRVVDTQQVLNIPMCVRLGIEPGTKDGNGVEVYPPKNKVKNYLPANRYSQQPAVGGVPGAAPFAGFSQPVGGGVAPATMTTQFPAGAPAAAPAVFAPPAIGFPGMPAAASPNVSAPPWAAAAAPVAPAPAPAPIAAPAPVLASAPQAAPPGWAQDANGQWVQTTAAAIPQAVGGVAPWAGATR